MLSSKFKVQSFDKAQDKSSKFKGFALIRQLAEKGFTMIELLIVIAVLGVLAVAVLSAINPIEQINRGRDTSTRSDLEQLLSAIDRHNAAVGLWPWQDLAGDTVKVTWRQITMTDPAGTQCSMLENLSAIPGDPNCPGTDEIKAAFVSRITSTNSNALFMEYTGTTGTSVYVCFNPQSNSFKQEADKRCTDTSKPNDYPTTACDTCPKTSLGKSDNCICLP